MADEWEQTRIDAKGRVVLPKNFRKFFQKGDIIEWKVDNGKLIAKFKSDEVEMLTMEYLFNRLLDLEKEINRLGLKHNDLKDIVFTELMTDKGTKK